MFALVKSRLYAIGVDISQQGIRVAQLADRRPACRLLAGSWIARPAQIEPGTQDWITWASQALRQAIASGPFKGRKAVGTLRPEQLMVETMRMPKADNDGKIEEAILARLRSNNSQRLTRQDAMVRYAQIEQDSVLAMVADRRSVETYLDIMELAGLEPVAIIPWPQAIAGCYARFFGRRQSDLDAMVILIYLEQDQTDIVISRHSTPLFARSIPIGVPGTEDPLAVERLVSEVISCRRALSSCIPNGHPGRVIFFSSRSDNRQSCLAIARQLQLQAQLGDCLAAVEVPPSLGQQAPDCGIDRRTGSDGWALAFGLSLSYLT